MTDQQFTAAAEAYTDMVYRIALTGSGTSPTLRT